MKPPPAPRAANASSPGSNRRERGFGRLESITVIHVASLLVFTAWDFGGETDFARIVISVWGSLASLITGYACVDRFQRHGRLPSTLSWLWPLVLLNVLVLAGTLNPSFSRSVVGNTVMFVSSGSRSGWPSSARPTVALQSLWQFDAIFLTCFNLAIVVTKRRLLRRLLFLLTANALMLAVFGTFQKLSSASGLYFGLQDSPNPTFFASFIYHNHWGAFMVLSIAAAIGLLFHHLRSQREDGARHSPALLSLVAVLFMAAAVPLSTSRSCTVLVVLLLTAAFFHRIGQLLEQPRGRRPPFRPVLLALVVFCVGIGGSYLLGRQVIAARLDTTRLQLDQMRRQGDLGDRTVLYADTWRMARDHLWFGWGLGAYGTVFPLYNTQKAREPWFPQPYYTHAHSDWLQAVAEVGLTGTALIILLGAVPLIALRQIRRRVPRDPLAGYLFLGCALVALYAWVEFPFANPAVMSLFWLCFFVAVRHVLLAARATASDSPCPNPLPFPS